MSSAKRRVKRRVARMVKMDVSHHLAQFRWHRCDSERQARAQRILVMMRALGYTMGENEKQRSIAAIDAQRAKMGRVALQ